MTNPITLVEIEALIKHAEACFDLNVPLPKSSQEQLLASARRLLELESALEYIAELPLLKPMAPPHYTAIYAMLSPHMVLERARMHGWKAPGEP